MSLAATGRGPETTDALRLIVGVAGMVPEGGGGASISLVDADGGVSTVAATTDEVAYLDRVQYEGGTGPCLAAIDAVQEMGTVGPDSRWPSFSEAATAAGYPSVSSWPIVPEGRVAGSLNVYSRRSGPLGDEGLAVLRDLSAIASLWVARARSLQRAELEVANLKRALDTRTAIGQAQGILMERRSISAEQAFHVLRRASQRSNLKLAEVASRTVASVAGEGGER